MGGNPKKGPQPVPTFSVNQYFDRTVQLTAEQLAIDVKQQRGQIRPVSEQHVTGLMEYFRQNEPVELELWVTLDQGMLHSLCLPVA